MAHFAVGKPVTCDEVIVTLARVLAFEKLVARRTGIEIRQLKPQRRRLVLILPALAIVAVLGSGVRFRLKTKAWGEVMGALQRIVLIAVILVFFLFSPVQARILVSLDGLAIRAKIIAIARVEEIRTIRGGAVAVATATRPYDGADLPGR